MKTVRIMGMAPNLGATPPPLLGEEVWLSNWHYGYNQRLPRALEEWTRYFNLHSRKHQIETYPDGYKWYQKQDGTRPIYFQKVDPTIPGCIAFPGPLLQEHFKTSDKPQRFFTFTGAWLMALAMHEGFERVELWGFELRSTKPAYKWERPCFFYWVKQLQDAGIEVMIPPELDMTRDTEAGDPNAYVGPLYGYETKPED